MVLSDSPSIQEILWNFSRFKDEKKRLTVSENPHVYTELPTSPEAYGHSVKIDPTEDFRQAYEFYVLIDKPEIVRIVTDQDSQYFGNFWSPKDAIIFKGLGVFFLFPPFFLMSCQTSAGGSGGKLSSRHLSEARTVGSVSRPQRPFRELPGIVVHCSRLSQTQWWTGKV